MQLTLPRYVSGCGMDKRVAVHFGGGGQEDLGLGALCEAQNVHGAKEACLGGLDRVVPAGSTPSQLEFTPARLLCPLSDVHTCCRD